jgi:hypothetical protein
MSTDGTRELLSRNQRVAMFDNPETEFDDYKHRDFKNNAWKEFRNCDFIINCDFDEFLYHSAMIELLSFYLINGIQLVKTFGYQMYSDMFIESDKQIYEAMNTGARDDNYNKPIIFNPDIEPNYSFGAHEANPKGKIEWSLPEIKLLHYKMIGPEFVTDILARNKRLSERNKNEGLSVWPEEKGHRFNPYEVYENIKNNAIKVI